MKLLKLQELFSPPIIAWFRPKWQMKSLNIIKQ